MFARAAAQFSGLQFRAVAGAQRMTLEQSKPRRDEEVAAGCPPPPAYRRPDALAPTQPHPSIHHPPCLPLLQRDGNQCGSSSEQS